MANNIFFNNWSCYSVFGMVCSTYFKSINMPIAYFGFVWAILNLSTGFASFNAHYFEKKWSNNQLLLFIFGISLPIIFIVFASPIVGLCLILMVFLIRGDCHTYTKTIYQRIDSFRCKSNGIVNSEVLL